MQMRTPAGQFARRIGDQVEDPGRFAGTGGRPGPCDDTQQIRGRRPAPATNTGSYRIRTTYH
jgi:hypothetical protein